MVEDEVELVESFRAGLRRLARPGFIYIGDDWEQCDALCRILMKFLRDGVVSLIREAGSGPLLLVLSSDCTSHTASMRQYFKRHASGGDLVRRGVVKG